MNTEKQIKANIDANIEARLKQAREYLDKGGEKLEALKENREAYENGMKVLQSMRRMLDTLESKAGGGG